MLIISEMFVTSVVILYTTIILFLLNIQYVGTILIIVMYMLKYHMISICDYHSCSNYHTYNMSSIKR